MDKKKMGRPTELPLTRDLRVRIDEGTYSRLEEYCRTSGKNRAVVIREAMAYFLDSHEN